MSRAHTISSRPAFTLPELAATLAASAGLLTVAALTLGLGAQPGEIDARAQNLQLKDSTQIRGLAQGFIIFAQNNRDVYPLPSMFDKQDMTVAAKGTAKDTSANIMSMLIFTGMVSPELLVSPADLSADIRVYENYEYTNPKAAQVGAQALWDPAFSVDFTDKQMGHLSYAHQIPAGERRARWSNTFNATEPILGNRGPRVAAVRDTGVEMPPGVAPIYAAKSSLTFKIHGNPDTWEGNIAYNDNHVNFETSVAGDVRYRTTSNELPVRGDVLFFDEPDALKNDNAFLSIFTTAGPSTKYFRAIWD